METQSCHPEVPRRIWPRVRTGKILGVPASGCPRVRLRMTTILLWLCAIPGIARAEYPFNEFVTSYWYGPPVKFNSLERYKEIKEANFNVVFPAAAGAMSVDENRKMLDYCRELGMKAIVADVRMVTAIGD